MSRWSKFTPGSCASPPPGERGFFHDGRFATLSDILDNTFGLGLADPEKADLIEYQ
jgi:hypothetical protein